MFDASNTSVSYSAGGPNRWTSSFRCVRTWSFGLTMMRSGSIFAHISRMFATVMLRSACSGVLGIEFAVCCRHTQSYHILIFIQDFRAPHQCTELTSGLPEVKNNRVTASPVQTEDCKLRDPFEVFPNKVVPVINEVTCLHSMWDPGQSINVGCSEPGDKFPVLFFIPFVGC